ncbi:MAG: glycerophosphodiester phosphodiesterase family protein [Microbacteriaceae bacterium]|nr:glycerophosphodiester phosphodiesterase family protein [Microbacteriaceae bacterium]
MDKINSESEALAGKTLAASPMIIGHRGACAYFPEHTRGAYDLAFEQGADAVEPDIVVTQDGVLLIRHENEISGTTNVAEFPEFAGRKRVKTVDGEKIRGWFAEDFTWEELQRLSARERLPRLRPDSAVFDDSEGLLRLADLLQLVDEWQARVSRVLRVVIELKHVRYFQELGFDLPALLAQEFELAGWGEADADRIIFECFELSALVAVARAGLPGKRVYLVTGEGYPADAGWNGVPRRRSAWYLGARGLELAAQVADGISVPKQFVAKRGGRGRAQHSDLVRKAAQQGLEVYIWTLRAEREYLMPAFKKVGWLAEYRFLISSGVSAVFADHPDLALAARNSLRA